MIMLIDAIVNNLLKNIVFLEIPFCNIIRNTSLNEYSPKTNINMDVINSIPVKEKRPFPPNISGIMPNSNVKQKMLK